MRGFSAWNPSSFGHVRVGCPSPNELSIRLDLHRDQDQSSIGVGAFSRPDIEHRLPDVESSARPLSLMRSCPQGSVGERASERVLRELKGKTRVDTALAKERGIEGDEQ